MNQITDVVAYELDRNGLTLVRNKPSQTLQEVVAQSNAISPKVHVAIHSNASASHNARGPEVYVHKFGTDSERLAKDIYDQLQAISPAQGLGVKEGYTAFGGKGYYELRRTKSPAVLIEVAYHDNPQDSRFIIDNIYEIGVAIAKGILKYFGRAYRPDNPENIAFLKKKYDSSYVE